MYITSQNVTTRDTAPSDQIDTEKINLAQKGLKIPNDVRTVKFAMEIFGRSLSGTRTRTAVTSVPTPPAQSPAP